MTVPYEPATTTTETPAAPDPSASAPESAAPALAIGDTVSHEWEGPDEVKHQRYGIVVAVVAASDEEPGGVMVAWLDPGVSGPLNPEHLELVS